ncbi:MAG TPA: hypothetical protein VN673_01515 [Clostridia bacterium]|nr:hypothetical protein [Clostridia bacterium]
MINKSARAAYSLRRGLGMWELTFARRRCVLKHEQGLYYVAYLLYHPGLEPIHALDLYLRLARARSGSTRALAGPVVLLTQRGSALDDAESERALFRKRLELEAILEDDNETAPVKAEAERELGAICDYQNRNIRHTRDNAHKAADAVRKAIHRLHHKLERAVDREGEPHAVLRAFAAHLEEYLLAPSNRGVKRARRLGLGSGTCFCYRPVQGVVWR